MTETDPQANEGGRLSHSEDLDEHPRKRIKAAETTDFRTKGVAPIQRQYLIETQNGATELLPSGTAQDDIAEAADHGQADTPATGGKHQKQRGQNTSRKFGSSRDAIELCQTRITSPEFSPRECSFGDKCRLEHDLRRYLEEGRRPKLETFDSKCPVWEAKGVCNAGWKCRWVQSHMVEKGHEDGRKELLLVEDEELKARFPTTGGEDVVNGITTQQRIVLNRRKAETPKSDVYIKWLDRNNSQTPNPGQDVKESVDSVASEAQKNSGSEKVALQDERARYAEPPLRPSEKRRLYFGEETPVLAPLTTQGNLPFRRLCVELGAQMTYSEMAMSLPLIQGAKPEWALLKAHSSEVAPPRVSQVASTVAGYDNSKDLKFGAQIAASKHWQALKATEIITTTCPSLRLVDLNCGCPIDLIYRTGAGSALLDSAGRMERIIRGMNVVSGAVPVTVKLRMGTKDAKPTALKLVQRLVLGGQDTADYAPGPSGVAAITLHGRSRQQRYTKDADWAYIAECAALITRIRKEEDHVADTVKEVDPRDKPSGAQGKVFFLGNGDCYSHFDYNKHLEESGVDAIMLARGPLIKPWLFEEIQLNQYLDKSASERLQYVERFARYGLEAWGADEVGLGTTRRFLLDWLSFAHRYIPVGILEHLPPRLQDRPPRWRGRNELETLLGSTDYRDWMKISDMFLGPAHPNFRYVPKNKSNAYEAESQG
ncbi:MAG: tRNA-dihydrouridine synthase 3 [Lichina confinis]|nr:MAG: tRNA-dihydrouridine synthase 3 [Lichina confinis]